MDKEKFFTGSWNPSNFGMEDLNCSSEQLTNSFFNPNWENSVDQSDPFESALSSIVSSPVNSNAGGENIVLRELIGRLGSICNSNEISSDNYINLNNSTNTSCYTTPLNSPPKINNLSTMDHQIRGNLQIPNWAPFHTDPGFVERAAKFSSLGGKVFGDSVEESSVSEQIPVKVESVKNAQTDSSGRKRKSIPKGKGKEIPSPTIVDTKVDENEDSDAKRSKSDEKKSVEPPKDYIHVRARRGQATDSHSLAERVRREKIGERMKFLQDLVPGCNKVTGKALMLDEIINYVQSLQCQVEFLSMKLSTVSPRAESTMESLVTKDMYESNGSVHHSMYRANSSGVHNFPHGYHSNGSASTFFVNHSLSSAIRQNSSLQVSHMDGFGESAAAQVPTFWEDDLQSFVQMGFVQNDTLSMQRKIASSQMKVEL